MKLLQVLAIVSRFKIFRDTADKLVAISYVHYPVVVIKKHIRVLIHGARDTGAGRVVRVAAWVRWLFCFHWADQRGGFSRAQRKRQARDDFDLPPARRPRRLACDANVEQRGAASG